MNDSQFFPGAQPLRSYSVPCASYPLIVVLLSFLRLTGSLTDTKPACLNGDSASRDRPDVAVLSFCES